VGFDHWHASLAVFGSVHRKLFSTYHLVLDPFSSYPAGMLSLASAAGLDFATGLSSRSTCSQPCEGCLIPLIVSLDPLRRGRASVSKAVLGIAIVTGNTYYYAMPVANEGIVLPFLVVACPGSRFAAWSWAGVTARLPPLRTSAVPWEPC